MRGQLLIRQDRNPGRTGRQLRLIENWRKLPTSTSRVDAVDGTSNDDLTSVLTDDELDEALAFIRASPAGVENPAGDGTDESTKH